MKQEDDLLYNKALEATAEEENIPFDKELASIVKSEYGINNRRQIAFVVEYIKNGGNATKAYKTIYGEHINNHSAAVLGGKILKKVDISILLEYMGHGLTSMKDALDELRDIDPDKYLKHWTTLSGMDKKTVELTGKVDMPTIIIKTTKEY